jgi:hypothetical protein
MAEDTMRSVVIAAGLLAGVLLFAPSRAAAQDPETPPPPPRAPQEGAVPRGEVRSPRAEKAAPADPAPQSERAGERAPRAADASSDQRRAEPRGSVRQPPASVDSIAGAPVDRAIPRSEAPPAPRTTIVHNYPYRYSPSYSVYYDPWGFGSFGVGYFYYSPWTWGPYAPYGYGYPHYGGAIGFDVGAVKLKVKQRDAEVWVDGYYAGTVDDFDGIFQALKLDSGGYRIEVRKRGFETLTFDVRVQPDRTITFRGEMRAIP